MNDTESDWAEYDKCHKGTESLIPTGIANLPVPPSIDTISTVFEDKLKAQLAPLSKAETKSIVSSAIFHISAPASKEDVTTILEDKLKAQETPLSKVETEGIMSGGLGKLQAPLSQRGN